jgi:diaminopimelate epimerase
MSLSEIPFVKYHGLGNDYIVLEQASLGSRAPQDVARAICDRHYGAGSDGILVNESTPAGFALRIFNPDGSLAEKSGNGLRIFARYLYDNQRVGAQPFGVRTSGGDVTCAVQKNGAQVVVDMGRVRFDEINGHITLGGEELRYCFVNMGNPHCVVLRDKVTYADCVRLGPLVENAPRFPNRTNVQFLQALDRANIQIEIWERGANYTLASGSSSCAASAVARKLGLCDSNITAHMPGGQLSIQLDDEYNARLTGPVAPVCKGVFFIAPDETR